MTTRREQVKVKLVTAGVGRRHADREVAMNGAPWSAALRKTIQASPGSILVISGSYGTGKTQLAAEWLRNAQARHDETVDRNERWNCIVRYAKASEVFRHLRDAMREGKSEADAMATFQCRDWLVLDEMDNRAGTPFEERSLRDLIDDRYRDQRSTMLIFNKTVQQLRELPTYLRSRLAEAGVLIECNWSSFREKNHGQVR